MMALVMIDCDDGGDEDDDDRFDDDDENGDGDVCYAARRGLRRNCPTGESDAADDYLQK